MACNYVKDFDFGTAGKMQGKPFAKGGCATTGYAKGGKVDAEAREAVHKHERNMHPKEPLTPMKKGGKVVEKGSGEVYASKAAMMRHEKGETKAEEMKEHAMKKGGATHKMPDGSIMAGAKHDSKKSQKVVRGPAMSAGRDPRAALIATPAMAKGGLYANIHAKRARIEAGSNEKMNKVGSKNAPSAQDFKDAAKTAMKCGGKVSKK
jgi:hypothetical protein